MKKQFFSKQNEDIIIFKHSSFFLRLFNFCVAWVIFISNVLGFKEGSYSFVAIGVGCFCLIISCYQNSWAFFLNEKLILNKKGILFFAKKQKYSFSEVSAILIEKYERSGRKSEYTEISLQFKDGEMQVIESDKTKKLKCEIEMAKHLQLVLSSK